MAIGKDIDPGHLFPLQIARKELLSIHIQKGRERYTSQQEGPGYEGRMGSFARRTEVYNGNTGGCWVKCPGCC